MKIYVVLIDLSYEYDNTILVKLFKDGIKAERFMLEKFEELTKDNNYDIVEQTEYTCTAYNDGFFAENHCEIRVMEKEVEE